VLRQWRIDGNVRQKWSRRNKRSRNNCQREKTWRGSHREDASPSGCQDEADGLQLGRWLSCLQRRCGQLADKEACIGRWAAGWNFLNDDF
jgi:hypothetical protein